MTIDDIKIDKLIRSNRKSFSIELDRDANLTLRAPKRANMNEIREVIIDKKPWILKKRKQILDNPKKIVKKNFIEGEQFLFLGEAYPLAVENNKYNFHFDGKHFVIRETYLPYGKEIFTKWYKIQAKQIFTQRILLFSSITNIPVNNVKITSAKTRWGSCSSKKNLNFSWKLVMAPSKVIDYVLVHELAHIIELNHSAKFWILVERMFPDYKKYKEWLDQNGYTLEI